jgi:hypothetical protein
VPLGRGPPAHHHHRGLPPHWLQRGEERVGQDEREERIRNAREIEEGVGIWGYLEGIVDLKLDGSGAVGAPHPDGMGMGPGGGGGHLTLKRISLLGLGKKGI